MLIRGGSARHLGIRALSSGIPAFLLSIYTATGNQTLYYRSGVTWAPFPTAIAKGTGIYSTMIVGDSKGNIILNTGSVSHNQFNHYTAATNSWGLKAHASAGLGSSGGGAWVSDTEIYAWGSGRAEKWNGTAWSDLTSAGALTNGSDHGWASADSVWVCNRAANLWHYTTAAGWVDNFGSLPTVGGNPMTQARDVWIAPTGNVYILAYCGATALDYLIQFDGVSTWTNLGRVDTISGSSNTHSIWGVDDTHIWMNGRYNGGTGMAIWFFNGTTIVRQKTVAGGTGLAAPGKTIMGLADGLSLASCAQISTGKDIYNATDGATWVADAAWPDALYPEALGTCFSNSL